MSGRARPLRAAWAELVQKLVAEYLNTAHAWPWVVKFSAGKDSTFLLQAVVTALLEVPAAARLRPVWVVNNDTLVENPVMAEYARRQVERVSAWATTEGLPMRFHITTPAVEDSFWVLLIGRGYPTPWHGFRWCTNRLKIKPSEAFITERIAESGKVLVLLGSRKDESASRRRTVEKNSITDEARLAPDPKQTSCLVWQPIEDFTTDEVWMCLYQFRPPWGGTNKELNTLYAAAAGGEMCQTVMFESQADSCGTGGRFGCWTCTVVPKDKSLRSMAEDREELLPFVDFREYLIRMRNTPGKRYRLRRSGALDRDKLGHVRTSGPFTLEAREELLAALMRLQRVVGVTLISTEECWAIVNQWELDGIDIPYQDFTEAELERIHREQQKREADEFHLCAQENESQGEHGR